MEFVKAIAPFKAAQIVEILGCPERTAFAWLRGERLPPEWVQRLVLEKLKPVKRSK